MIIPMSRNQLSYLWMREVNEAMHEQAGPLVLVGEVLAEMAMIRAARSMG